LERIENVHPDTFAKPTAIGGPHVPVCCDLLPLSCCLLFSDSDRGISIGLHLISFGLTRACARAEALALRADASAAPPQRAVRGSVDLVLLGDGLSQTLPVSHA